MHPLEPLSAPEVAQAVQLLRSGDHLTSSTRVISIMLKEPPKAAVHAWPKAPVPDREASAVLQDNASNRACTVLLNLTKAAVTGVKQAPPGVQPTLSVDEQIECEQAV